VTGRPLYADNTWNPRTFSLFGFLLKLMACTGTSVDNTEAAVLDMHLQTAVAQGQADVLCDYNYASNENSDV
jgi:hypothetical protein